VCVLPSMHVFATVAPSTCQIGEYVLSVVLTNFRADGGDAAERDILVNEVRLPFVV
jgi:hypothetical protein